jgi:hypothetical protein
VSRQALGPTQTLIELGPSICPWGYSIRGVKLTPYVFTACLLSKHREKGRAIAQAVSRWLPTAAVRVRTRVWSCVICSGQSGAGAGFLRVLRFPLPIFILPIALQSPSSIIRGWYNRPVVAAVPSGLSLTPLIIIIIIINGKNTYMFKCVVTYN